MLEKKSRRKRGGRKPINKEVRKEVKKVMKVEIENKLVQATVHDTAGVTGAGSVSYLSDITQGLTDATRVGDTIRYQWLTFRYLVQSKSDPSNNAPYLTIGSSSLWIDNVPALFQRSRMY